MRAFLFAARRMKLDAEWLSWPGGGDVEFDQFLFRVPFAHRTAFNAFEAEAPEHGCVDLLYGQENTVEDGVADDVVKLCH